MKTFLFVVKPSPARNMDKQVFVYRLKRNDPIYIGSDHYQTRSTKGAYAVACTVIASARQGTMSDDRYGLKGDSKVIPL